MGKNTIFLLCSGASGTTLPTTVDENKAGLLILSFGAPLIQQIGLT